MSQSIRQCLHRHGRIAFRPVIDQHIRSPVLRNGFLHHIYRIPSHLGQLLHNLCVRLCSFLGRFIGHPQGRQQAQHREWRGKRFHALMLFGE